LSQPSPGFRPRTVHSGFAFEKVYLGQVYLSIIEFPAGNNLSTNINSSLLSISDMCERPHQTVNTHTFSPQLSFHLRLGS
jgi:hypothetical protein